RALVLRSRGARLTHRFLPDPGYRVLDAYRIRRPTTILIERRGHEVWRFAENGHQIRPTDADMTEAVARLDERPRPPRDPRDSPPCSSGAGGATVEGEWP